MVHRQKIVRAVTFVLACFCQLSSTRGQESGTSFSDPEVNIIPSVPKLQLTEGESTVLSCDYNGVNIVSVNWIFLNRVLKTDTPSNVASGMNETGMLNLTVTGTDESSMFIYSCSVITGTTSINVNITIEILAIPNPHLSINRQGYSLGDRADITCSAAQTSPPITKLTILGPDNSILYTGRQTINDTTTATITVENITKQSFGEYVCLIGNAAGLNTSAIRLKERGYFQVNMLYQISNETCEEYKRDNTTVKLNSIETWLTEIMLQECSCDVASTNFDSSSFLICSTEGRALTYRTMMDYSSKSGNILTSTILHKLQLFFYQSYNKNINISGIVFITIIECPVIINNLTSTLCKEPPASCYVYNQPLIYGLTLGGALIAGWVFGALCLSAFCGCANCLRKKRSYKPYTSNNQLVVIQNEHELETKIEEASKTSSEDEEQTIAIALSGTSRSSSFSAGKPTKEKRKSRAKTIHLTSVPENNPPPIPKSPRPSPPRQKRYSATSLPLPTEPPQIKDAPVPRKRTLTLSIQSASSNDDYHRRTATLPLPSKTSLHKETAYMEVVTEKEIQTADTAALVVVEEQTASQEIPQIYDDIGDLKRDDSPDLTQFDDIITPAKSLPPTQDEVYI